MPPWSRTRWSQSYGPSCWVSHTSQPSATQTANTNVVRAEQHLRMNQFPTAPIMEPPEIITPFFHSHQSRSVHMASHWLPSGEAGTRHALSSCATSPVTRRNCFILLQVLKGKSSKSSQGDPVLAASPFPISLHEDDAAGGKKAQSEQC